MSHIATEGDVHKFIINHQVDNRVRNPVTTHANMTGGKCYIEEGEEMNKFRTLYALHLKQMGNGQLPCISEQHTVIFPLYVDVDLCAPVATLSEECVEKMARIMSFQVKKFYVSPIHSKQFVCIVCTKTGQAKAVEGGYKHGLHLHWPHIRVRIDEAKQIRCSMIAGLNKEESWEEMLGQKCINWDDVLDHSVYSHGLRMIGAPKAKLCPECKGSAKVGMCSTCDRHHNCRVIDYSVYKLGMVLRDGVRDEERYATLQNNPLKLLLETSVRCPQHKDVTPGYAVYEGCPKDQSSSARGTKRKARDNNCSRFGVEVGDPRKMAIFRAILVRHSVAYKDARAWPRYNEKTSTYYVPLTGEGATYCLNKQGEHNSNRVYMTVRRDRGAKTAESFMKCFCPCMTVRVGNSLCKYFQSASKTLSSQDANVLFPTGLKRDAVGMIATTSAAPSWDHPDLDELLKACNDNAGRGV